jgi:hypothetical protein
MLKKIGLAVLGVVVVFLVVVAVQPAEFQVQRSATLAAPADIAFAQVNDFHAWNDWSPWSKRDPNMKTSFEGPSAGTGASYGWVGNREVGEGRMTITDSKPNRSIDISLEFKKPFEATNHTLFTFTPQDGKTGDKTLVTWSMDGKNNFVGKAFGMFMNMDKLVGGDFETGLAQMQKSADAALEKRRTEQLRAQNAAEAAPPPAAAMDKK